MPLRLITDTALRVRIPSREQHRNNPVQERNKLMTQIEILRLELSFLKQRQFAGVKGSIAYERRRLKILTLTSVIRQLESEESAVSAWTTNSSAPIASLPWVNASGRTLNQRLYLTPAGYRGHSVTPWAASALCPLRSHNGKPLNSLVERRTNPHSLAITIRSV